MCQRNIAIRTHVTYHERLLCAANEFECDSENSIGRDHAADNAYLQDIVRKCSASRTQSTDKTEMGWYLIEYQDKRSLNLLNFRVRTVCSNMAIQSVLISPKLTISK